MNITNIPAPRVAFIDQRTGLMAREWYRFFLNLFQLTGAGTGPISLTDLQVSPQYSDNGFQINLQQEAMLSQMLNNYDYVLQLIEQQNLMPANVPQDNTMSKSNRVMQWLSM